MVRLSSQGPFTVQSKYTGRSGRKRIQGVLSLNGPKRQKENNRTVTATEGRKEAERFKIKKKRKSVTIKEK